MKMNMIILIIGIISGCTAFVSPQMMPPGFSLPAITHVDRNWFVMSTDQIGAVVTRVHRDKTGSEPVTYGLETSGPPTPFEIDPNTGVVRVNDTLKDKENRSYSLWVTASDGSSIPQRTEVFATITDNSGSRKNVPRPPPFTIPNYQNVPLPEFPRPVERTTKTPVSFISEITVPETTITTLDTSTQATVKVDEPHEDKMVNQDESKRNVSKVPVEETQIGSDLPLTVIPLVAIGGLVAIVAAVIIFVWKKNSSNRTKPKKEDMSKDSSGIVLQDSSFNMWDRPRAYSNRYEAWDANHLQISEETTISSKEEPRDEWEFPRHRLRIFNIVGEGAFGQVWRAQAVDIDGKKGEQTVAVKTLKENASEKEKTDLIQELTVMKNLGTHPNVVRLIGCCTEKEPTLVIMEFVSLGKLQQFLRDSRAERHYGNTHGGSQFLTSRDLTHFAFQVARGMDFLSSKGVKSTNASDKEFVSLGKLQQFLHDSRAERHYGNTHGGSQFLTSRDLTHFAFQVARGMDFLSSKGVKSTNASDKEFVSLGKLQQYLRNSRAEWHYGNTHGGSQFLTSRDLTHFAFQVARGMDFLSSKGIIHRDLAARNVLITEERTCKVADFGFARDVAGTHVYERKSDGRLPIRWMAPESLYDDIFSVKSDIWSFGVLLWEIVTLGSTPYPGLSAGDVMRKVREGHRLEKPEHCRRELYNIMYYCWEAEPTTRPDFKEVVSMLERLLCTEMDYIELERFPDHSYYNVQHLDGEKL